MTVRLYGHLDLWPPESGKCSICGLYTFSEDAYSDGAIARSFIIAGSIDEYGRMKLSFNFTNTYDPSDDDGVGAEIRLDELVGRRSATPFLVAWNKGSRRLQELVLQGYLGVNWPNEDHPPGKATLSIKSLPTDAFRERTSFKWVKKSRATGHIGYRRDDEETRAEALRLWQSPHPSLLSVEERDDLPLFSDWF